MSLPIPPRPSRRPSATNFPAEAAHHLAAILVFFLAALVGIRELLSPELVLGHNWDSPFSGLEESYRAMLASIPYTWDYDHALGYALPNGFSNRLWWATHAVLGILLQGRMVAQADIVANQVLGAFGIYVYVTVLLNDSVSRRRASLAGIAAGLYLMFSSVVIGHLIGGAANQLGSMAVLPYVLVVLEWRRRGLSDTATLCLLMPLSLLVEVSLHNTLFAGMFVGAYATILFPEPLHRRIRFLAAYGITTLLAYAHWVIPMVICLAYENIGQRLQENLAFSNLIDNVPPLTEALWGDGYIRPFYNYLAESSYRTAWAVLSLSLCGVVIVSTLWPGNRPAHQTVSARFWLAIYLLFVALAAGFQAPFGVLVEALYRSSPLMAIFRSPQWLIMPLAIAFAVLVGLSFARILEHFRWPWVSAVLVAAVLAMVHPAYLSGNLGGQELYRRALASTNWYKGDHLDAYAVPKDYAEAIRRLYQEPGGERLLALPMRRSPYFLNTPHQRQGSGVDPILNYNPPKPVVVADLAPDANSAAMLTGLDRLIDLCSPKAWELLDALDIGYIILKRDYAPPVPPEEQLWNAERTVSCLHRHLDGQSTVMVDGETTLLLRLNRQGRRAKIYIPDQILLIDPGFKDALESPERLLARLGDLLASAPGGATFLPAAAEEFAALAAQAAPVPKATFRVLNPTRYEITVTGASGAFPLVFSEAFHPLWKLTPKDAGPFDIGAAIDLPRLDDRRHTVANGFANGWLVDLQEVRQRFPEAVTLGDDGTATIRLFAEFAPQRVIPFAVALSVATLAAALLFLLLRFASGRIGVRRRRLP
ncbi:hypothetical protein [Paramagnetospirillum magnetotacticum]|nr:hypothetical protein [Paramagnetospirillum magnetotacticum]